jgi:hypothetical protein
MVPKEVKDLPEAWVRCEAGGMLMVFIKLYFALYILHCAFKDVFSDIGIYAFSGQGSN